MRPPADHFKLAIRRSVYIVNTTLPTCSAFASQAGLISLAGQPSSVADRRDCRPIHSRRGTKRGKRFSASAERSEIGISACIHDVSQNRVRKAEGAGSFYVGEAQFAADPPGTGQFDVQCAQTRGQLADDPINPWPVLLFRRAEH